MPNFFKLGKIRHTLIYIYLKKSLIIYVGFTTLCIVLFQSCIIKRYCEKRFVPKYLATIGIDYGVTK